jgi:hypothetical protein
MVGTFKKNFNEIRASPGTTVKKRLEEILPLV